MSTSNSTTMMTTVAVMVIISKKINYFHRFIPTMPTTATPVSCQIFEKQCWCREYYITSAALHIYNSGETFNHGKRKIFDAFHFNIGEGETCARSRARALVKLIIHHHHISSTFCNRELPVSPEPRPITGHG